MEHHWWGDRGFIGGTIDNPCVVQMKKRRSARQWVDDNEKWIWRGVLAAAAIGNMWLTLNFVGKSEDQRFKDRYWQNFKEQNCRITQNEKDIEILKERTRR